MVNEEQNNAHDYAGTLEVLTLDLQPTCQFQICEVKQSFNDQNLKFASLLSDLNCLQANWGINVSTALLILIIAALGNSNPSSCSKPCSCSQEISSMSSNFEQGA